MSSFDACKGVGPCNPGHPGKPGLPGIVVDDVFMACPGLGLVGDPGHPGPVVVDGVVRDPDLGCDPGPVGEPGLQSPYDEDPRYYIDDDGRLVFEV